MLVAAAGVATAAVILAWWRAKTWIARLSPILLLGGAHLVYNTWAIALARTPSANEQLADTFIAFAAFAGLALLVRVRDPSDGPPRPRQALCVERLRCPRRILVTLLVMGFVVFLYLTHRAGAVPVLSSNPNAARLTFLANGYLGTLFTVPLKVLIELCGFEVMVRGVKRAQSPALIGVAGVALLVATANRGLVVEPIVPVILFAAYRYNWRLRTLGLWALAGLVGFSAAGFERALSAYGPTYLTDVSAAGFHGPWRFMYPLAQYVAGTSTTFDRTIQTFPRVVPFQNGSQLFGPFLHHQSTDLYLKNLFGLDFQGFGLALGAMNAFFLDFGTLGIVFGFAIGGLIAQYFFDRSWRLPVVGLPAYLVVATEFLLSNYGSPIAYLATVLTPLVTIYLLTVFCDPTRGARARARSTTEFVDVGNPESVAWLPVRSESKTNVRSQSR